MVVQFTRIRVLQLGGNGLKGTLPEALITCTNLTTLELHQNDIEGKIPDALGTALINLVTLRLDHNSLTGASHRTTHRRRRRRRRRRLSTRCLVRRTTTPSVLLCHTTALPVPYHPFAMVLRHERAPRLLARCRR
jgi:hypothetical protein